MARRRTKKDKIIAQLRRQVQTPVEYKYQAPTKEVQQKSDSYIKNVSSINPDMQDLYSYDPALLIKDLRKTILLSGFAFAVIFFLSYWL